MNRYFNIYFGYDNKLNVVEPLDFKDCEELYHKKSRDENGEFFLKKYKHPSDLIFYTFGYMADDERERPGHGGYWSSNCTTINKIFDVDLIGVAISGFAASMETKAVMGYFNVKNDEGTPIYRLPSPDECCRLGLYSDVIKKPQWYDRYGRYGDLLYRKPQPSWM